MQNITISFSHTPKNCNKNHSGGSIGYKSFIFNGGEVSVKLDPIQDIDLLNNERVSVVFFARIQSSTDLITLLMLKDAVERVFRHTRSVRITLLMPYVPYARQDRVCDKGEAFSLWVFTNLINSMKFDCVTVLDPHSEVSPALINNVKIIEQSDILNLFGLNITKDCLFVSPDAGANKKIAKLAKISNHKSFIRADKLRDLTNGAILETVVYATSLAGKTAIIADDIIDGGATFIPLAKQLKNLGAEKVILLVTHGIFAKGIEALLQSGIDHIYTTNSFRDLSEYKDSRFSCLDVGLCLY